MNRHEMLTQPAASARDAIATRFSCRAFLRGKPVPEEALREVLAVERHGATGGATPPWKTYVLQGASLDDLVRKACAQHDAVFADPSQAEPEAYAYYPEQWFSPYLDRRRENGWSLYGLLGIAKGEKQRMHAQHQRNFRFFDAPVGLFFTVDREAGPAALLDYGMFLQAVMLAARRQGLHTCPQAAWNNFPSIILEHVGAGPNEMLVCGMSLGYADPDAPVNTFHTPREPVEGFTRWMETPAA